MTNASESEPVDGTANLASGVRTVGAWTLLSRILGMVRDVAMAAVFGAGAVLDAFTVAFRVPNLFRRLFGEGALTAAFLPAFVRERERNGETAGWRLATVVFVALFVVLAGMVALVELLLWVGVLLLDPSPAALLLVQLTAVLLPYVVLVCLVAQMSAVLHGLGRFTVPAAVPVVLNVTWIAALWWVVPGLGTENVRILAVAATVVVAGVLQFLVPLPALFGCGYRFDLGDADTRGRLREILAAMLPVLVGLSLVQLNTLIDAMIAWGLSAPEGAEPSSRHPLEAGTAAALYLGQRMYQFPLGVFGVALGTVLFPLLTRHAERGRADLLRDDLGLGLRLVFAIGLPASLGLVLLAEPITELLFRHGRFDANDAAQTAAMIAAYAVGVWAYSGVHVLQRAYYALDDRITPMRIGLIAVGVNVVLDLALVWPLGGPGLAYATAASAVLHVGLLAAVVQGHVGRLEWESLLGSTTRITLATLLMGACCVATLWGIAGVVEGDDTTARAIRALVPMGVGVGAYLVGVWLLEIGEVALLLKRGR